MDLRRYIRTIPDHPRPGILFRDVTTLLGDAAAFRWTVETLAAPFAATRVDKVAGIEARGFILGGAVADRLGAGFVPLRKRGKLPHRTLMASYALEYGVDELHMHEDAVEPGQRVLLIDDLIATGGTALAGLDLLRRGGADVLAAAFVVDLPGLGGAEKLRAAGVEVRVLVEFPGR